MKELTILIGNYGSGKTEIAINLAVMYANQGYRTLVVDLDKVNDYFRMSDKVALLENNHINVVSPTFAGTGATPSSMSAAVASAFADDWDKVIFDVGGDSAGALSLGRYSTDILSQPEGSVNLYDIVNVFRPMSESVDKIIKLKNEMESFARLKVTGFVNNSNLLSFASAHDIATGYELIKGAADITGLPIAMTTGRNEFLKEFLSFGYDKKYIGVALPLETYMHRSWETFTRDGF